MWTLLQAPVPMPAPTFSDWERVLAIGGPLYAMFLVFIYFVVWYGPGIIAAHREMVKTVGESSKRSADAAEGTERAITLMTDSLDGLQSDMRRVRRSLMHAAEADLKQLEEAGRKKDSDVVIETKRAKDAAMGFDEYKDIKP